MNISEQLQAAIAAVEDKKARDILLLDLRGISTVTDYFLLVTGNSSPQVKAITDNLKEKLGELGHKPMRVEGLPEARWILVDYGDLVVHIMQEEERRFYNLERLWGDAQVVHL
ncbi:MAG: ribosome silencing factor [Peptococcaceae bacterium]|nr:ribosome silencing factor [Peptococcaceae bacterium]